MTNWKRKWIAFLTDLNSSQRLPIFGVSRPRSRCLLIVVTSWTNQRPGNLKTVATFWPGWIGKANEIRQDLTGLLKTVLDYKIPRKGIDHESLVQYDRCRLYKESLLDRIVETCVESENATCMLAAVIAAIDHLLEKQPLTQLHEGVNGNAPLVSLFAAVLLMDLRLVKEHFPGAIEYLHQQPLLYVSAQQRRHSAEHYFGSCTSGRNSRPCRQPSHSWPVCGNA